MHFFTDYIQPLTTWIHANPNWALLITFVISFTESLAIIGSIIPGSVTMTAIGILAGSGVMRIDLTLISAALGAIAGDTASYFLGYKFRNSLPNLWPFRQYPRWLSYGKEYFAKHGGKSVLIGRFIGPLRSIIPVIAGMMHMNHWHFLIANVLSAVGWSIVYVMPGILIGAASSELSAESSSRLFILVLVLLIVVWLVTVAIKWLIKRINLYLRHNMHRFWMWSQKHPILGNCAKLITPQNEINHSATVGLIFLFIVSFFFSLSAPYLILNDSLLKTINLPIYSFFQSLHTPSFAFFFIIINLTMSVWSLLALFFSLIIYCCFYKDWQLLKYWLSIHFFCFLISLMYFSVTTSNLEYNLISDAFLYPTINLLYGTASIGFFVFYINHPYHSSLTRFIKVVLASVLYLNGAGLIYLGDSWFTHVLAAYSIGLVIFLGHWILFRRDEYPEVHSKGVILFPFIAFLTTSILVIFIYFNDVVKAHPNIKSNHIFEKVIYFIRTI